MRRRTLIVFILLNIAISVAVAFGVISLLSSDNENEPRTGAQPVITVPILVTNTPDPNYTPPVIVVTATPLPGSVILPTDILETPGVPRSPAPTLDPELLDSSSVAVQAAATVLPANCILHTVEEGDTPFGIGEIYGVSGFDIMEANELDEESARFLAIGDRLLIPLEGCTLTVRDLFTPIPTIEPPTPTPSDTPTITDTVEATATPVTPTGTPTATLSPTITPTATITIPATAVDAQVEITQVINPGDITAEGVEIRNLGGVVDLTGWTLTDVQGNVFTFPEQRLFTNGLITVHTRQGENTPISLFWGRNEAVWGEPGEVVTLANAQGVVQAVFVLP